MEPITHLMTGACLARAGFNRKAAYATLAMTLAAEAPDLDTLWSVRGPVAAFQHHRGITHTFLGLPFEAAIVVGVVYLIHRYRLHRAAASQPATGNRQLTTAPLRWPLLYAFALIALLSHILLDWTNNYGVRPFFPFNPRWYADSIVFIFDPVLFAVLLIALIAPALFGLINSEVGARKQPFRGRGWAIAALVAMVALWGWRQIEHDAAINLASAPIYGADRNAEPLRLTASPSPINPYLWHVAVETPAYYQLATVDTRRSLVDTDPEQDILQKPPTTTATEAAKRSPLGQAYLDWSSWPVVTDIGPVGNFPATEAATAIATPPGTAAVTFTAVTFKDLRFMYDTAFFQGRHNPPLSATVYLDPSHRVLCMEMNGSGQKESGQPCSSK